MSDEREYIVAFTMQSDGRIALESNTLDKSAVREEIVRCRDCVSCYRDEYGMWCCLYGTGFYRNPRYEGDYCSRGKRRDA